MNPNPFRLFWLLARPLLLLAGLSMSLFGLGVARYLGVSIEPAPTLLGLMWVLSLQLAAHVFTTYFALPHSPAEENPAPFGDLFGRGDGLLGNGPGQLPRPAGLLAGMGALGLAALAAFGLLLQPTTSPALMAVMGLMGGTVLVYTLPPARLRSRGYGELLVAVGFGNLVPLFAFLVVTGEVDRLVAIAGFPITFLILAMALALEFPTYAWDQHLGRQNLMARLGWETTMSLHNYLLLLAFLWLGASVWIGLPAAIVLPAFLPLPLAGLQILTMRRIALGGKPNWRALTLNAAAITSGVIYLLGFGFWTR
ncbi:MAG: prenyltransferase [Chloroflexi bacterium]|nr:prenyltransferase [Chloroflexota bacterium]